MSTWFTCACCRKPQQRGLAHQPEDERPTTTTRPKASVARNNTTTVAELKHLLRAPAPAPTLAPAPAPTAPASTPSNSPASFLIDGDISIANSSWTINTGSHAWGAVFADAALGLNPVTPTGIDLVVTSTMLGGITFSNEANGPIFTNTSPVVIDPQDSTVLGAILAMVPSTPTNVAVTFAKVRSVFGITSSNSVPLLTSFINVVDQSSALELKLNTASTTRNALWAIPGDPYRAAISMTFDLVESSSASSIETFLNQNFGLKLALNTVNPQVVMTTTRSFTPDQSTPPNFTPSSTYQMEIHLQSATFRVIAIFTPGELSLVLSDRGNAPPGSSIYQRLSSEVMSDSASAKGGSDGPGAEDLPGSSTSDSINQVLSEVTLWYVQIGMSGQSGSNVAPSSLSNVFWQVGLLAICKVGSSTDGVLVSLTLDTRLSAFSGRLYFSGDGPSPGDSRQYDYQSWTAFPPSIVAAFPNKIDANIDIGKMLGVKPPPQVPTSITKGVITYFKPKNGNGFTFSISFALSSNPNGSRSSASGAPSGFDWTSVTLNLALLNDGMQTTSSVQVLANMDMGRNPLGSGDAGLFFDLEYVSNSWLLQAQADGVDASTLARFFDSSQAVNALGQVVLKNLNMLYTYDGNGDTSSFLITAVLVLGELELDMYYQYISASLGSDQSAAQQIWGSTPPPQATSQQSGWVLEAYLGSTTSGSNINSVISSITKGSVSLPDFVGKIPVNPTSGGKSTVALKLEKDPTSGNLVLIIRLVLEDLDVTFASLQTTSSSKSAFRIGVDKIPLVNSIPLVQQLPQPFDKLEYVYVADDSSDSGFTATELAIVNGKLPAGAPQFLCKSNNSGAGTQDLVVLQAGHHFIVVNKNEVVLDHVFQDAASQDSSQSIVARTDVAREAITASDTSTSDATPMKGKVDVQLPFLSINGITLQFKQGSLYMDVDGTMALGPIQGSVIGFEVVLNISKIQLNHLENIPLSFGIHGLGISVDKSPLTIAGAFIHDQVPAKSSTSPPGSSGGMIDRYMGGVSVGFEKWEFTAVGAYEVITSGQSSYKSVFVYAKLNGPLFTLAFATVSGVRAGFGYNSICRTPTMNELSDFPLLSGSDENGVGDDPIQILQAMIGTSSSSVAPWVSPKDDSYWVAVGLTLTAFGIFSITAVLLLGFLDSGVVIEVFADGIAQLPPDFPEDATLFYVEIYMLAELNTIDGFFTVQASLAPSSHVLVSSCRLTGGFALMNWFDPNAHSGDFVFTVGGYHPAYKPPSWYPAPARLGVAFTLGSMVHVTGTAYFAITPKCVMGGGGLHMGLDVGPVSAWLDMALDVFIQFKPFHYIADLSVSVGCAITINVWFVHVRISASIGAALHIEGPAPFGGFANVDYYIFSFTIHFGNTSSPPLPSSLPEFFAMVKTPGLQPTGSSVTPDQAMNLLKFVLTAGLYPTSPLPKSSTSESTFPDSGANSVWNTKAGTLAFNIDCDFALTSALVVNELTQSPTPAPIASQTPVGTDVLTPVGTAAPVIFSKPMHCTASDSITSVLTITISLLSAIDETTPVRVIRDFRGTFIMKAVPVALWASYDSTADPANPANRNPSALTTPDTPTLTLAMGVSLLPPSPVAIKGLVFLPFYASTAFEKSLGQWPLLQLVDEQNVLLATGEVDAAASPLKRWEQVSLDWTNFAAKGAPVLGGDIGLDGNPGPGMLVFAAKTLGWGVSTPSGAVGGQIAASGTGTGTASASPSWLLNKAAPDFLIANLGTQYPVLPRYSTSGTAGGS